MKPITKIIGTLVLILAVMAYTIFNYATGKTDFTFFMVAMALLSYTLFGMVNQLVQHLKNNR